MSAVAYLLHTNVGGRSPRSNALKGHKVYNELDEHNFNVFHAMRCRSIYYPLLEH